MLRKIDRESYVEIDHRESPGITPEQAAKVGSKLAVGAGQRFQSAVRRCPHCHYMIILNPGRTRPRGYCWSCDFDICDRCSLLQKLGHPCRPLDKVFDDIRNRLAKGQPLWLAESVPRPLSPQPPSLTPLPSPLARAWVSGKAPPARS
jgi:hypothetical protein